MHKYKLTLTPKMIQLPHIILNEVSSLCQLAYDKGWSWHRFFYFLDFLILWHLSFFVVHAAFFQAFISVVPCLVHDLFTKLIEVFKLFSFIQNYRFTYKHIPQSSIFVLKVTSVYYYSYRVNLCFSFKFTDFFDLFIYFALLSDFSSSRWSDIIKIGEWKSKIFFSFMQSTTGTCIWK